MRGNAWLKFELLAPYGGITRIRFKGSSETFRTSQPLAPPLCLFRIEPEGWKSTRDRRRTLNRPLVPASSALCSGALPQMPKHGLTGGFFLLHVGMENGKPHSVFHFPH